MKLTGTNHNSYHNIIDELDEKVYKKNFDALCLGLAIRESRKKYNISQNNAAISSDISQSYLSHVEMGEYGLSFHKLLSLSRGMQIPIQEIISQYLIEYDSLKAQIKYRKSPNL